MWSPSLSPPARGTTYSCSVSFAHFPRLLFIVGGRPPTPPDAAFGREKLGILLASGPIPGPWTHMDAPRTPDAAFGRETCVFHGPPAHVSHGLTDRSHTSGPALGREKLGVLLAFGRLAATVSWTHGKVYRLCVEIPSDLSALSRQK